MVNDKVLDFISLVYKMRRAQKDYFKYRKPSDLILSRELEKKVDDFKFTEEKDLFSVNKQEDAH